ncbi:putative N-acetyltransferase [Heterostelium album PN500]|uniref:RNA cytidine acetyltransferase n=1 Tax=Heterostelium pallidum (strain ATCC 26659 / Pp 5 / PN500) TaxID=670386 RepID=D3B5A9_HETP5|nr:putative N-acetyltransferase [Heterostelium album PN500]EFA83474.1 putative N-acetyltransferase [Heterostelium album PN500]|eukprot:XP_020435591.1 putative N-acetyltransferase [Heterostelium album PN500]
MTIDIRVYQEQKCFHHFCEESSTRGSIVLIIVVSYSKMVKKKIDNRIRTLIENAVATNHRSFFVVVGDNGKDQVPNLHYILSKSVVKARPSVLWCYKKELSFSKYKQKKMKMKERMKANGTSSTNSEDPFDVFISTTNIRYSYYSETHKILGNTFGMLVLQDFEAITPNLLARTIETVEGGGLVVLLLRTMTSLKQLYTMAMDVHSRFREDDEKNNVVNRFNERFLLSLAKCNQCLVMDDELNILPISTSSRTIVPVSAPETNEESELRDFKQSVRDTDVAGELIEATRSLDQAQAVLQFIDAISEKTLRSTVTLTAGRGRGKSCCTRTGDCRCRRIWLFQHFPELVVIDEAAAIPLPYVRSLLGPYLVFLSSTINGYEGTGRSLSLKLIRQLREQSGTNAVNNTAVSTGRILREIQLNQPIRYAANDPIESWLNNLLCLDATVSQSQKVGSKGCPHPSSCQLYYVNRDTLFSYHKASEAFLQRLVALFVASHYKNTPNDLLLMADSPDHHLFILLGPMDQQSDDGLPEILCAVQVSLEGEIAREAIMNSIKKGYQASGDLIPWTLTQQFQDEDFPRLSGARIVRIATHPDYQKMGYGSKTLELLTQYYQGEIPTVDAEDDGDEDEEDSKPTADESSGNLQSEVIRPKKNLPPLLYKLTERKPELLHYMGVSYGVTKALYQFWSRAKYLPVYIRLTTNDITGEHTCIMLRELKSDQSNVSASDNWLFSFYQDFRKRFINLLGYEFRSFESALALQILQDVQSQTQPTTATLTNSELELSLSSYDIKRLESFANNIVDFNVIIDMLPTIGKLLFRGQINDVRNNISNLQTAVLLAMSLQHKTVDQLAQELGLQLNQIHSLFAQTIRKVHQTIRDIRERAIEERLPKPKIKSVRTGQLSSFKGDIDAADDGDISMIPIAENLDDELEKGAKEVKAKLAAKALEDDKDLAQYLVQGDDEEWNKALKSGKIPNSVSIKSQKRKQDSDDEADAKPSKKEKPTKNIKRPNLPTTQQKKNFNNKSKSPSKSTMTKSKK